VPFQAIPRERAFYDLLEQAADGVAAGAVELDALVGDFEHAASHEERIRELERQGDDLTHKILGLLNTTFVTPFDRHDIHHLASSLDDVLDGQEAVVDLLELYRIQEPIPELRQQTEILMGATRAAAMAVRGLRSPQATDRSWIEILRYERDGDHVFRRAVASLYSGDYKAMDVLKWKDILQEMESAIDCCEDIANTVESIVVKQA
jgi:uncharacterized protein Yka (UPF0111/DUF47 family)